MTRVIGLDPSTSSFGIARPDGTCRTIRPKAGADDNPRRIHEIIMRLDTYLELHKPDVAVIEEPIPPKFATAALRLGEVRGATLLRLFERSIPIVQIKPAVLKQYATGKGNAKKPEMLAAAQACGAEVANTDESDAWWLWALGRHGYHHTVEPAHLAVELHELRNTIRLKIDWPRYDARVGARA